MSDLGINSMVGGALGGAQAELTALRASAVDLGGARPARLTARQSAEQAGEAFEAYLVGFLAKEMRESVPEGPFGSGAVAMFADLFDQEIGRRVAEGPGLGLKAQITRSLLHGSDLSRELAPSAPSDRAPRISSGFGLRSDPLGGGLRSHRGVDVAAPAGTPVRAARSGVVRFAGEQSGYGKVLILDHGSGVETLYAHCASLAVESGERVLEGQQMGTVGSTGRSTGPHLHFEVHQEGTPVDPEQWSAAAGVGPLIDLLRANE